MTPTPNNIPPLSNRDRHLIFLLMVLAFVIMVPAMVFYAIGYRFDLTDELQIKTVGGLYVSSQAKDSNIYIDDKLVENMRIFRNAAYIQNLEAGVHEMYVEREGLHTWVKRLPVFEHLVTEVQSFNIPVRPQVRLLTEWNNDAGVGMLYDNATSTHFSFASTTNLLEIAATTTATSTLNRNLEYEYIASRFASSSEEAALLEQYEQYRTERFSFATKADIIATTTATTTKEYRDTLLYKKGDEVYVTWLGDREDTPYYYCVTNKGAKTTPQMYGTHVYEQLVEQIATTTDLSRLKNYDLRFCRDTIRIDRLWQNVKWFDFMPGNEHLVLMLLDDGLYVVEIDDRSWQNTQLLYPGNDIEVLIDGDRIFVQDSGYLLEVYTEIAER